MAKTVRRKSKRKITRKNRKNYNKKGEFIIDASKVHPASIILSK
jgi:hypothetical protein